jgi:uncharacterized protein YjgD (DUF1641 family)
MANTTGQKYGGRKKGTPNKTTKDIRQVYSKLLEDNQDQLQDLFDKVAEKNPQKALELLIKVSEFVIPKLRAVDIQPQQEQQQISIKVVE